MKSIAYYDFSDTDEEIMTLHHPYYDEIRVNSDIDEKFHRYEWGNFRNQKTSPLTIEQRFVDDRENYPFAVTKYSNDTGNVRMYNNTDCRSYTERRNSSYRMHTKNSYSCILKYLYSVCIFFCIFVLRCSAQTTTCDFKGSGLDLDGKGIQPVYLSCASGKVDWHYPRAALRILLQYPSEDRDFHGCIKATPEIEGARLFVEGHRSLVPLYAKDDGKPRDRVRCFTSYKGRAALYLEAEPSSGFRDLKASFEYDLQPLPKGEVYDPMEECRPCSNAELVRLYCSADFAARGFIISTEDDPRLQQTKVTLAASRVFQQTTPIFSRKEKNPLQEKRKAWHNYEDDTHHFSSNDLGDEIPEQHLMGHLFMPLECGARSGAGEFMVLGTIRLGQPVLRCAPRIEDWKKIVFTAQDHAHCVLEA